MVKTVAYLQMCEAIETLRASLATLEEHFAHYHAHALAQDLEQAKVKVQDLYAQVEVLQQRLNRCGEDTTTQEALAE
jgi:hypothetical protein